MIASSKEDPEQEYLCKYKVGKDSIFGSMTTNDMQGREEWLVESELDGFVETEEEEADPSIHWH